MEPRQSKEPGATTSAHRPPAANGAGSQKGNREVAALTHKVASAVNTTAANNAANGHPATNGNGGAVLPEPTTIAEFDAAIVQARSRLVAATGDHAKAVADANEVLQRPDIVAKVNAHNVAKADYKEAMAADDVRQVNAAKGVAWAGVKSARADLDALINKRQALWEEVAGK